MDDWEVLEIDNLPSDILIARRIIQQREFGDQDWDSYPYDILTTYSLKKLFRREYEYRWRDLFHAEETTRPTSEDRIRDLISDHTRIVSRFGYESYESKESLYALLTGLADIPRRKYDK